jgi:hypothetical protein
MDKEQEDIILLPFVDVSTLPVGTKFWYESKFYTVMSYYPDRSSTICRSPDDRYNNTVFQKGVLVKPVENPKTVPEERPPSRPGDPDWLEHLEFVKAVAEEDIQAVNSADRIYNGSWKRRGGIGAFMMLCRKWDRLEHRVENCCEKYDVFHAILTDTRREGCIDDVRDLRRYLLLVEAEMRSRGFRAGDKKLEDSGEKKGGD